MGGGVEGMSLALLRRTAGLTQEELAERSGLTVRAISNLERGLITRARMATLASLAQALELSDDDRSRFVAAYRQMVAARAEGHGAEAQGPIARQLPARVSAFTGRDAELALLLDAMALEDSWAPALITGLGGIGKTALAVEAAARLGTTFTGGQLYAKLSTSEGALRDPARVLGEFLRTAHVAPRAIPATLGERSRLWRTVTAESPVLLLLDDAANEDQVRPLLPAETSRVLVTSRRPLGGLETSVRLRLGPVDSLAAEGMLALPQNVNDTDHEEGVRRLIEVCAGMPLALRLVSARMAMTPHISFATTVERLTRELRLDDLSSGDRQVSSSIAASVRTLEPTAIATVSDLARLSLPTFTDWHLAALSGLSRSESNRMADALVASGLLDAVTTPSGAFRYTLHDLVRVYLREHGLPLRDDALDRLVGWSVHLQLASTDSAIARPVPHVLWPPRPEPLGDGLAGSFIGEAKSWFDVEYPSLMALMDACIDLGKPREAGALLAALRQPMTRAGLLDELIAIANRCAAISADDRLAYACAQLVVGSAMAELGRYDVALQTIHAALDDLEGADVCTLAGAWYEVGWLRHRNVGAAGTSAVVAAYEHSIELHRSIGNTYGELGALCGLIEALQSDAGDIAQARVYAEEAHAIAERFDDYRTVIKVDLSVWRILTDDANARVEMLTHALRLAREQTDVPLAVTCLTTLAAALREAGEVQAALDAALEAVELAQALHRPADLDAALAELEQSRRAAGEFAPRHLGIAQAAG